ncbi:hypothetical protein Dsin_012931 [Dipteronia sinensis]|uniref:Uncharacterized protein n=1 Tax=Dipteronia sinensis TaxID=43782 RepID=A0AAE0E8H9_9ROSI|nr:hypothetical protein Dsin_012931 [Dipteronia sinensis]
MEVGSTSARILIDCLKVFLGDGGRTKFWKDLKIDDIPLAEFFPRIYALAVNKSGVVGEFGAWNGCRWCWNIVTWRPILGWEELVWYLFLTELRKFKIRKMCHDSLVWSIMPSGNFSVCSFRRELEYRKLSISAGKVNSLI